MSACFHVLTPAGLWMRAARDDELPRPCLATPRAPTGGGAPRGTGGAKRAHRASSEIISEGGRYAVHNWCRAPKGRRK